MAYNMARRAMSTYKKVLTKHSINPNVINAKYAVRGEIVLRSIEHAKTLKLKDGNNKLPFGSIVSCNIGNPQECGQKPMTFPRQVMSLLDYPELLTSPTTNDIFPDDVVGRAQKYIDNISGGIGAYSHSKGVEVVRQEVAAFLLERDGFATDPEDIFLTDGASPGIQNTLNMIISSEQDGIMIPIPQYPLYSAAIALLGGSQIGYYLNEDVGVEIDREELDRALMEAREKNGLNVKAMAVINPGNPSGQCLTYEDMEGILQFCHDERIILLADEVYQENIWQTEIPFYSFKKVLRTMEAEGKLPKGDVELFSYHSISKGFLGECGKRGGYMELVNINDDAKEEMYKLASLTLCSNVAGQVAVGMMVNPPKQGEASYELYEQEKNGILNSLQRRAILLVDALNKLEGVVCQPSQGALYAFPSITLPDNAIKAAESQGKAPDAYYCLELLDQTGIVVVPGSGFGQKPNTFHFRTTILPQEDEIVQVIERMSKFHADFLDKYRD